MGYRAIPRFVLVVLLLVGVAAPFIVWAEYAAIPTGPRIPVQHSFISPRSIIKPSQFTQSNLHSSRNIERKSDAASDSATIITGLASSGLKTGITNSNLKLSFGQTVSIALVCPTFTEAAYHNSFYKFYELYRTTLPDANVTSNLGLLNSRVNSAKASYTCYAMTDLAGRIKQSIPNSHITILADPGVDSGVIFNEIGGNRYDVVVLGHQEYVTQQEYDNLKKFVSNGGTMVLLDGNVFYAEVKYNSAGQTVNLVEGHQWAFNGISAWRSIGERWANETREWVGSNYLCDLCKIGFAKNPFGYRHHEEQYISNPSDIILYKYRTTDHKHTIATYELLYGKGKVIGLGIYADDIEFNSHFESYFSSLIAHYAVFQKQQ